MHMAFIRVPDGLIWHKSPTSGPSRVATMARCSWRMSDEAIWYENECHMHFLARHNHKMHYISIFWNFLTWLSNFKKKVNFECQMASVGTWSHNGDFSPECEKHVYTLQICCIKSYTNFHLAPWHLTSIKWHHGIICELSFKVAFYVGYGPYWKLWLFQQWQRHRHVKSANNFQVPWHIFPLYIMFAVNMYWNTLRFEIFVAVQFIVVCET